MAGKTYLVSLDAFEQRLMVNGLTDYRNNLLRAEKPTEDLDELLIKVFDAPLKKRARRTICETR